ncbi:MAG: hypothetical protein K0R69_2522, partial [Clostridia bacterium]|nr:hypothetical protein [Clostridia bacterium]
MVQEFVNTGYCLKKPLEMCGVLQLINEG